LIRQARKNLQQLERYITAARQQLKMHGDPAVFSVRHELHQVTRFMKPLAQQAGVKLTITQACNYKLYGDPVKFNQLVANLTANAIDAYNGVQQQNVSKRIEVIVRQSSRWITVRVSDWGSGLSTEKLPQVFMPFYTTKADSGMGIGLAMVKRIAEEDFHGSISVTSSSAQGTCFTVKLAR